MINVLIVKISSLGDIIQTFPLLPYLKQQAPQVEVDWVVEEAFAELVQAHPLVRQVLPVRIKQWRSYPFQKRTWREMKEFRQTLRNREYDKVLDLQGNIKSGCLTFLAKSRQKIGFDYASVTEWPNILATHQRYRPPVGQNIREDYLFLAQSAFQNFIPADSAVCLNLKEEEKKLFETLSNQFSFLSSLKVMVCPGSQWLNKQLSKDSLRVFLQLIARELEMHFVFVWGSLKEKEWGEELAADFAKNSTLLPKLSLPVLQNLMGEMDIVISMDSLPLHLAGTTSTATYSVFGPSSAHKYKPRGQQHRAFQGQCPYQQQFEKRCTRLRSCPTGACLKELRGEQLVEDFFEWYLKWISNKTGS